jgi:hypothetical protein
MRLLKPPGHCRMMRRYGRCSTSAPSRLGAADRHQTDVVFLALRLPAKPSRWPLLVPPDELVEGRLLDACDIFRWPVRASTQSQVPPRAPDANLESTVAGMQDSRIKDAAPDIVRPGDVRCQLLPA